jgi:hypothetical protein
VLTFPRTWPRSLGTFPRRNADSAKESGTCVAVPAVPGSTLGWSPGAQEHPALPLVCFYSVSKGGERSGTVSETQNGPCSGVPRVGFAFLGSVGYAPLQLDAEIHWALCVSPLKKSQLRSHLSFTARRLLSSPGVAKTAGLRDRRSVANPPRGLLALTNNQRFANRVSSTRHA